MILAAPQSVAKAKLSVDEYYRLADAGLLRPECRVELIEGNIRFMSPIGERHAACVDRISEWFHELLRKRGIVRTQNPCRLDRFIEIQPDVAILKRRNDYYSKAHPGPDDVLLLIEVCGTSLLTPLLFDRNVKLPMYAHSGIPETWLVDPNSDAVEVYREPSPEGYRDRSIVHRGGAFSPLAFPDAECPVDELLGPAGEGGTR